MITIEELKQGKTLAQAQGMTAELAGEVVRLAGDAMAAGRYDEAETILEGLAVTNPVDPAPWALLSQLARRRGKVAAARFCGALAVHLAPEDPGARLVLAEALLAIPEEREEGRGAVAALASAPGVVGERARALLKAFGA